eukprot:c9052_g1_i1.p1 GENE.c9052_g1_i1~~c9052_g1_i1.p1  ORF type:complete len:589 (+),score=146.03 c9052_g1_i1:48-1769(+)
MATHHRASLTVIGGGRSCADETLEDAAQLLGVPMTAADIDELAKALKLQLETDKKEEEQEQDSHSDEEEESPAEPISVQLLSAPAPVPTPRAAEEFTFQGWLTKEGGRLKTMKKRWFVLNRDSYTLCYFVKPGDELLGFIPLLDVGVISVGKKKQGYALELFPLFGGKIKSSKRSNGKMVLGAHEAFCLYAETEEDRDRWVNELNTSVVEHEKVSVASKPKQSESDRKDIRAALDAYVSYDKYGLGIISKSSFVEVLIKNKVSENVAKALAKVLDWDNTELIDFDAFFSAWRSGCIPADSSDGWRANTAGHHMLTPFVKMGAFKGEHGIPYTTVENFSTFLTTTYQLSPEVVNEIVQFYAVKDRITSIAFMRGVIQGIIPTNATTAAVVSEAVPEFLQFLEPNAHVVARHNFPRVLNTRALAAVPRDIAELIFDVATLGSRGKMSIVEFVKMYRLGMIPVGQQVDRHDTVIKRIQDVISMFMSLTGNADHLMISELADLLQRYEYSASQTKALCVLYDVDADGRVNVREFTRVMFAEDIGDTIIKVGVTELGLRSASQFIAPINHNQIELSME